MKVILPGSGAVRPDLDRWGPAQVVQVGGENLLFDCGRGASMRLVQAGIPLASVRRVFFTHHHFDHNCDFAYLFLTSWVLGRDFPMEIVGPRGTRGFCDGLFRHVYRDDIDTRRFHPMYSAGGCEYHARDVLEDELTLAGDGWQMHIVHVLHKSHIIDNVAYRIEAEGKSVVIVGDTTICPSARGRCGCTRIAGSTRRTSSWTGRRPAAATRGSSTSMTSSSAACARAGP